jgi:hypothetical protein
MIKRFLYIVTNVIWLPIFFLFIAVTSFLALIAGFFVWVVNGKNILDSDAVDNACDLISLPDKWFGYI